MIIKKKIRSKLYIIKKWKSEWEEYNHLRKLFKNVERNNILNSRIVFNTVYKKRKFINREFFIGKLLALNGAKVFFLLDDGVLSLGKRTKLKKFYKTPFTFLITKIISLKAIKTYKDKNIEIIYYSEILNNVDYYEKQKLRKYAISFTIRNFKTTILDYNNKRVNFYYKRCLKDAVLSKKVGEYVLNEIKADYFVTSHGIYSTWGPAYDFLKKSNIKSYVYVFIHNHSYNMQDIYFTTAKAQTLSRCKFWQEYKNTTITKEMEKKVNELFNLRLNHKTKDTKIYYKGKIKSLKVNKNDGYKYHIAIFPSLIWDGNIEDRHIAFDGILDWLISTIDFLKNKNDVKIFLKFHPAEVTMFKGSAKIQNLIKEYLDSNDIKNLELIPTEDKIDTYEFLKSGIDLGICYDGILALEMPYLKIPVILGGVGGRFYVEGGNYTIKTREDYFKYFDNLEKLIEDFHANYEKYYQNIIRYSYWYLFENVIKLPILSKKYRKKINLFQVQQKDLSLNKKLLKIFSK